MSEEDPFLQYRRRVSRTGEVIWLWHVGDGRNNPGEALLEAMDALNYFAAELVRLTRKTTE